jgi:hypothetical protein
MIGSNEDVCTQLYSNPDCVTEEIYQLRWPGKQNFIHMRASALDRSLLCSAALQQPLATSHYEWRRKHHSRKSKKRCEAVSFVVLFDLFKTGSPALHTFATSQYGSLPKISVSTGISNCPLSLVYISGFVSVLLFPWLCFVLSLMLIASSDAFKQMFETCRRRLQLSDSTFRQPFTKT